MYIGHLRMIDRLRSFKEKGVKADRITISCGDEVIVVQYAVTLDVFMFAEMVST